MAAELTPLVLVDAVGGALAALAGGVANALGVSATAVTLAAPSEVPPEVVEVLGEVGMRAPSLAPLAEAPRGAHVVFLGIEPAPADLVATERWAIGLLDGVGAALSDDDLPPNFERLSSVRRARDELERRLEVLSRS
jgi:hypothetical protein